MKTLNGLQTNAAVLEEASKSGTARQRRSRELSRVVDFLKRIGLKTSDLDRLNAIHITGTKGKVCFVVNLSDIFIECLHCNPGLRVCYIRENSSNVWIEDRILLVSLVLEG